MSNLKTVIEQSLIDQGATIDWSSNPPGLMFGGITMNASQIAADITAWLSRE